MTDKLIERIKNIARSEGIDERELILEEANFFLHSHKEHGGYSINLEYNTSGKLNFIKLLCGAENLANEEECPHHNEDTLAELHDSIVYSRNGCKELILQAERKRKYCHANRIEF